MAGKVGAPYGNKNAVKAGKIGKAGAGTKAYRAHASAHVNYSSPKFLAAARAQKRRGY